MTCDIVYMSALLLTLTGILAAFVAYIERRQILYFFWVLICFICATASLYLTLAYPPTVCLEFNYKMALAKTSPTRVQPTATGDWGNDSYSVRPDTHRVGWISYRIVGDLRDER